MSLPNFFDNDVKTDDVKRFVHGEARSDSGYLVID